MCLPRRRAIRVVPTRGAEHAVVGMTRTAAVSAADQRSSASPHCCNSAGHESSGHCVLPGVIEIHAPWAIQWTAQADTDASVGAVRAGHAGLRETLPEEIH